VCHFTTFTNHKPITYAFQQQWDKCSLRQFNHLDFVAQFMTDLSPMPSLVSSPSLHHHPVTH
jgi:hypothetical protein